MLVSATAVPAASLDIEASTDLRRRGLSWSDGKPAVEAWGALPLTAGLSLVGSAATLRGSPRHGGADALLEAGLRYDARVEAWSFSADARFLGFPGASGQNYAQLQAAAARDIGPLQLAVRAAWAPPQSAIGGSNLYLGGTASAGIPGTPVTVAASIGRSMGSDDGSGRSRRLRPDGDYTDFRLDADYVLGRVTLGASLTGTSISTHGPAAANSGTRLLLRTAFRF